MYGYEHYQVLVLETHPKEVTITEGTTDATGLQALIDISDGEEDVFTQTVVQTQKHITKYFTPKTKRQGQKKLKEGKKTPVHYVSRNNHDSSDPDDPPEVTNESETDPVKKYSDQKTNMKETGDEDFVTDTSKKFLVTDLTKKYPKLKRAPTTEMKEKFKSQKPTP